METFGELIRRFREAKKLPLRRIAALLDIDTSILSKIERGERQAITKMIPILAKELDIDFKTLQINFLTNQMIKNFSKEKYFQEAMQEVIKELKK